ncbi:MAG: SAM-dependent DNA methyltransferase [Bacteroidota bacterium]
MTNKKTRDQWQFGDFQTPVALAQKLTSLLKKEHINPATLIEPTCGQGAFLVAALHTFPCIQQVIGVDINPAHVAAAATTCKQLGHSTNIDIHQHEFFSYDWQEKIKNLPQPFLIIGNPPWVTNAALGRLKSDNLPLKSNFQKQQGWDALTGKSNFDISESMIRQYLTWIEKPRGAIAVLCKTSVARKILRYIWRTAYPLASAKMIKIDAKKCFNAATDACFLILDKTKAPAKTNDCLIFDDINDLTHCHSFGFRDQTLLAHINLYEKYKNLCGTDPLYRWRSGVKHDCAKVMELSKKDNHYVNGLNESLNLEQKCVFPMLKSSDISHTPIRYGRKYMLITQAYMGQHTQYIQHEAPKTWQYLSQHADKLDKRASAVYCNSPRYAMFGIGDYSFAPFKIAISGFYKKLHFQLITPYIGRPVILDDTIYFIPCWSEEEAQFLQSLLNSNTAQNFFKAMIFWGEKRPIKIDILKRLDIKKLATNENCLQRYHMYARYRGYNVTQPNNGQLSRFIKAHPISPVLQKKRGGSTSFNCMLRLVVLEGAVVYLFCSGVLF